MWTAPESSAAGARRTLGRFVPWADLGMEDVGGSSDEAVEVDTSDIAFARRSLDTLEATRREYLVTLRQQQRQYVLSRNFLAQQRHEVVVGREELSRSRAELERRGAELEERERGLALREAAIDASGTTEQLQQQLGELRAELDNERARFEREQREQMADWHRNMANHEEQLQVLNDRIQGLETANEGLRKEVAEAATRAEAARNLSVNTTLEFERQIKAARTERDRALERQRDVDDELKRIGNSMKKFEEARDAAKNKADTLAISLAKVREELKLHLDTLEKVHGWTATARQGLGLTP